MYTKRQCISYNIWSAWSKVFFTVPITAEEIRTQKLWGNSLIIRAGKPYMQKELREEKIDHIQNIITEQGQFKSFEMLKEPQRNKISMLLFNSVKAAIPKHWIQIVREDKTNNQDISKLENYKNLERPSKTFYCNLIKTKPFQETVKVIWENELKEEIDRRLWEGSFDNTARITISTKLRIFQYQVIHKIITTNVRRAKYTVGLSPKCTFCFSQNETILHLLYECEYSRKVWKALEKWLMYYFKVKVKLTPLQIICNTVESQEKDMVNTCVLIMKRFIYVSKCYEKIPEFINFLRFLADNVKIEQLTAALKGRSKKHYRKWKKYYEI